jgi:flagellar protein FliS
MSQGEQLITLFDEALKNLHYGSMMMKNENYVTSLKCTVKCSNIFTYLSSVLDEKQSISDNLNQLYTFFNQQIAKAEASRNPELLEELVPLVQDLRDTWVQADKLSHMNK